MASSEEPTGADTRDKLVLAATREFSGQGYEGASLRRICAAAGVTTGALYFFFKNKEDLFRNVIEPVVQPLRDLLGELGEKDLPALAEGASARVAAAAPEAVSREEPIYGFLEVCFERRALVQIMVKNRETPVMEAVLEEISRGLSASIQSSLETHDSDLGVWDAFVVSWLADIALESVIGILETDRTLADAFRHMQVILDFIYGGCRALRAHEV